jgi:DNA-directed RNA polymerase specialized sigma24 family protein
MFREETLSASAPTQSLTREEFAKVYDQCRASALKIAISKARVTPDEAEDALQNATIYVLENLERFPELTPSYFKQLVLNNARMIARSENARAANREHGVGDSGDLADVEEADTIKKRRRKLPAPCD